MPQDEKIPAGSIPVNQMQEEEIPAAVTTETVAPATDQDKQPVQTPEYVSKLEKMLADSQSMIGKQGKELGDMRAQFDKMSQSKDTGPGDAELINEISRKMDDGDLSISEGLQQVLAINSKLTAEQVLGKVQQQLKQEKIQTVQNDFLDKNPDYQQVLKSGELNPYLKADPLADEYTAYHQWKADKRVSDLQKEYEQKIAAAKEEGARLAKGADAAGKVLGKQGNSALPPPKPSQPFKNNQEATAAMMQTLQAIRSTATPS